MTTKSTPSDSQADHAHNRPKSPLLITTGDPAGIGMDIVLGLFANTTISLVRPVIVLGCHQSLVQRKAMLSLDLDLVVMAYYKGGQLIDDCHQRFDINNITAVDEIKQLLKINQNNNNHRPKLWIIDIPCPIPAVAGVPNPANAIMVAHQLDIAHALAVSGVAAGIITAPLAKSVMIEGGIMIGKGKFSGHTEYFMDKCALDKVVMMLANSVMKVALLTTHLPLRAVADAVTQAAIVQTVRIICQDMRDKFAIISPKILVCGLNPHAGENGHLGDEEVNIINPALAMLQKEGINVSNALPADTLFTPKYLNNCDVVLAMYHDQGLAPLKSHGFGQTVNITLGLPYIRTSVDHGTAFDLAGTGRADGSSLVAAVLMASLMADKMCR